MFNRLLLEAVQIEVSGVPIDTTGAAHTGDWYNLREYNHITFVIMQGAWAGGTPAVTLKQATDVSGTGSKALAFSWYWSKVALTGTVWTRTAVSSNTFNLTATANTITVVEVEASDLDLANNFDCCGLDIASPGANTDLLCVQAILSQPRYSRQAIVMGDPKTNT